MTSRYLRSLGPTGRGIHRGMGSSPVSWTQQKNRSSSSSSSTYKRSSAEAEVNDYMLWIEQACQLVAVLVVAAIVAMSTLTIIGWIKECYQPFCDSNSESFDNCIPCPEHGICQGGQLECLTGYNRRGKYCIEDKFIDKSVEKFAHLIKDHVCYTNGKSICNGAGAIWLAEDEVLDAVKLENKRLQGAKLWLVQERGLELASEMLDAQFRGVRVFSCPSNIVNAYKPLGCRLEEWIFANLLKLLLTLPLITLVASLMLKYWRYRRRLLRAEQLYMQVCEALEAKATGQLESPGKESWIVASRLRDHLLRPSERKNRALWMEVEGLVQEDSRIEQYPKIVKGESRIVWEWQVEGALSPANMHNKVRQRVVEQRRPEAGLGSVKHEKVAPPI